jgi:uncharacterized protein YbaR (Trm112 family)
MNNTIFSPIFEVKTLYTQEDYNNFYEKIKQTIRCPYCHSRFYLKRKDEYPRQVYLNKKIRGEIWVTRLYCTHCKRSFAVLPPEIIPFKRYLSKTVTLSLLAKEKQAWYRFEKETEFDKNLLKFWWTQFQKYRHQAWVKIHDLYDHLNNSPTFEIHYNKKTRRRFMQIISNTQKVFHAF